MQRLRPLPCPLCQPRLRPQPSPAAEPRDPAVAFAFPYPPMRGAFASMCFLKSLASKSISPGLDRRSRNLLHHFPRKVLAHTVLQCFLEDDGVARNSDHVTVKHGIVFPQEVSFVHAVTDHGDKAALAMHHTAQVESADFQALLAGAAA